MAVPRRRLATACPGRLGTPPCGHYDPCARSSLEPIRLLAEAQAKGSCRRGKSAAPGPKSPRWSAERRASPRDAWRLARRLACRVKARPAGAPSTGALSRRSATPHSGCAKQKAKPGRKNAPRERRRLFEKVSQNAFRWSGISASSELGLYPPPCGEGRREAPGWGSLLLRKARPPTPTPTPNSSPQGGGERTECAE